MLSVNYNSILLLTLDISSMLDSFKEVLLLNASLAVLLVLVVVSVVKSNNLLKGVVDWCKRFSVMYHELGLGTFLAGCVSIGLVGYLLFYYYMGEPLAIAYAAAVSLGYSGPWYVCPAVVGPVLASFDYSTVFCVNNLLVFMSMLPVLIHLLYVVGFAHFLLCTVDGHAFLYSVGLWILYRLPLINAVVLAVTLYFIYMIFIFWASDTDCLVDLSNVWEVACFIYFAPLCIYWYARLVFFVLTEDAFVYGDKTTEFRELFWPIALRAYAVLFGLCSTSLELLFVGRIGSTLVGLSPTVFMQVEAADGSLHWEQLQQVDTSKLKRSHYMQVGAHINGSPMWAEPSSITHAPGGDTAWFVHEFVRLVAADKAANKPYWNPLEFLINHAHSVRANLNHPGNVPLGVNAEMADALDKCSAVNPVFKLMSYEGAPGNQLSAIGPIISVYRTYGPAGVQLMCIPQCPSMADYVVVEPHSLKHHGLCNIIDMRESKLKGHWSTAKPGNVWMKGCITNAIHDPGSIFFKQQVMYPLEINAENAPMAVGTLLESRLQILENGTAAERAQARFLRNSSIAHALGVLLMSTDLCLPTNVLIINHCGPSPASTAQLIDALASNHQFTVQSVDNLHTKVMGAYNKAPPAGFTRYPYEFGLKYGEPQLVNVKDLGWIDASKSKVPLSSGNQFSVNLHPHGQPKPWSPRVSSSSSVVHDANVLVLPSVPTKVGSVCVMPRPVYQSPEYGSLWLGPEHLGGRPVEDRPVTIRLGWGCESVLQPQKTTVSQLLGSLTRVIKHH